MVPRPRRRALSPATDAANRPNAVTVVTARGGWHLPAMTPSLAHEPWSREQIIATTDIVRDVLGTAVLGTYLYGSAVGGGLRSGSDLDILVVSNRSLTGDERSAIIGRLLPISGRGAGGGPARPIELTI